jgi:hypothetical protein
VQKTIPGAKEERVPMAVDKFWIMINKYCYFITDNYDLKFKSGLQTVVKVFPGAAESQCCKESAGTAESFHPN